MKINAGLTAWMVIQGALLLCLLFGTLFFLRVRKNNRALNAFSLLAVGGFIWSLGEYASNCLLLIWPDLPFGEIVYIVTNRITYAGMCLMGPASVFLSLKYAGNYRLYRDKRLIGFLFGTAALFYAVILTDPLHHWYYRAFSMSGKSYGPLMIAFTVYSYLCFLWAFFIAVKPHFRRERKYLKYMLLLYSAPVSANTLYMLVRDVRFDLTVLSVVLMLFAAYMMIIRHRPVNLSPIAAKSVLDGMGYPVLVLSPKGALVYQNSETEMLGAENVSEFALNRKNAAQTFEHDGRTYSVHCLRQDNGNEVLTCTDITEYKRLLGELERKNIELTKVQLELKRQMDIILDADRAAQEHAAETRRREITARLSAEVQTLLERLEQSTIRTLSAEPPSEDMIRECISLTVEAIEEVRRIIRESRGVS